MSANTDVIRQFLASWSQLNAEKLANFFTEDGTYHNMPAKPVSGREQIRRFIEAFLSTWTETQWEIVQITEKDDIVFCERLDRTKTTKGDVDLPCFGVFEMKDGKIRTWRDYFDMNTYVKAMSV